MNEKIDFVVTWVNNNDVMWRQRKELYEKQLDIDLFLNGEERYRDWELIKYWFRAVEKHAPWVNNVFFITEGHLPDWINKDCEKLKIINHHDYIESQYLPTFNSNVIELNCNRIEGLSENFVLFNDDMFLNKDVLPDDFFKYNKPRDIGVFSPIIPIPHTIAPIVLNNVEIINSYFDSREVLRKNLSKFFRLFYKKHLLKNICILPWKNILGFYDHHLPISYNKTYFNKVQEIEKENFKKTFKNRFRAKNEINHWLIRYWQLCDGFFEPRPSSFGQYYNISDDNREIIADIENSIHSVICLNDGNITNFEEVKKQFLDIFEVKYNKKSNFEK